MDKLDAALGAALAAACGGSTRAADIPTAPSGVESRAGNGSAPSTSVPMDDVSQRKRLVTLRPEELPWRPLVPEDGERGPMVAPLWGDMASGPNGFLLRAPAGNPGSFHTHTNDYHGVAITKLAAQQDGGVLHDVAPGSYWFQPGGLPHLHACPGTTPCVGLRHYPGGKFDVAPAKPTQRTEPDPRTAEKTLADATWLPFVEEEPDRGAFFPIWGDMRSGPSGMYIKLPAGNAPFWHIHKADYHAVILQGTLDHHESGGNGVVARGLPVGSYYFQPGGYKHVDLCQAGGPDCIVYAYFTGAYDAIPK